MTISSRSSWLGIDVNLRGGLIHRFGCKRDGNGGFSVEILLFFDGTARTKLMINNIKQY